MRPGNPSAPFWYYFNQQPQPQSLLEEPQLPKPPQRRRIIIRIIIQDVPPQPLLQPQPIIVPPFAFLKHTMKSKGKCYKSNYNSAAYGNILPRYIRAACKKINCAGYIIRRAELSERNLLNEFSFVKLGVHSCIYYPR